MCLLRRELPPCKERQRRCRQSCLNQDRTMQEPSCCRVFIHSNSHDSVLQAQHAIWQGSSAVIAHLRLEICPCRFALIHTIIFLSLRYHNGGY